ncbi:T9SS type A sorting domain-containing protein [bacterium]|nr:T9SS type A sorting domain-containing protein [bacterium]
MCGNKVIKTILFFLLFLPLMSGETAFAQSSANYTLSRSVVDAGGNVSQSASYGVLDVSGQPSPVGECTDSNYCLHSGFLGGIFTTEASSFWTKQLSGTPSSLYCIDAVSEQIGWASGGNRTILKTTDGGVTWQDASGNIDDLFYGSIDGLDENTALVTGYTNAAGHSTIFKTDNGGTSWTTVFEPPGYINHIIMFDALNGRACGDPVDDVWMVYETSDGGESWTQMANCPSAEAGAYGLFNDVNWYEPTGCWFGTGRTDPPKVYHTDNGGATWIPVSVPDLSQVSCIAFNTSGEGLAGSGDEGVLIRTVDNGNHWEPVTPPAAGTIHYLAYFDSRFWTLINGEIYSNPDLDGDWRHETSASSNLHCLSLTGSNSTLSGWVVGNDGIIIRYGTESPQGINPESDLMAIPSEFHLFQNYPNPFNAVTTLRFTLDRPGSTTLSVFNLHGQLVETIIDQTRSAGPHNVQWNAGRLASGIYLVQLKSNNRKEIKKIIIQK